MLDRETALAEVEACVRGATQDSVRLLGEDAAWAVRALARAAASGTDPRAARVLGWYHWECCRALGGQEGLADRIAAIRYLVPSYRSDPRSVPEDLRDELEVASDPHASAGSYPTARIWDMRAHDLLAQFDRVGSLENLDEKVVRLVRTLALLTAFPVVPGRDLQEIWVLDSLGVSLYQQYRKTGRIDRLERAIEVLREVLVSTPADDPNRARRLFYLGQDLWYLATRGGLPGELVEAVTLMREAVAATEPDDATRAERLDGLGIGLGTLFEETGRIGPLREAAEAMREAVAATPEGDPALARRLSAVATMLWYLARHNGRSDVLAEAVASAGRAVALTPVGHPERDGCLQIQTAVLDALVKTAREATPPERRVAALRAAMAAIPEGHALLASCRSALGIALHGLFEQTGRAVLLDEAVDALGAAVAACAEDDPERAGHLHNLAYARSLLTTHGGPLTQLELAVEDRRRALGAAAPGTPDRVGRLSDLAGELLALSDYTGRAGELEEAEAILREVLSTAHPGQAEYGMFAGNLARVQWKLSERTGRTDLLEAAAEAARLAAAAPQDHLDRPAVLSMLGSILVRLAQLTGRTALLDEALDAARAAAAAAPQGHPDRSRTLCNLGDVLCRRSVMTGRVADQEESVAVLRESLAIQDLGSRDRSVALRGLNRGLLWLFNRTGRADHLEEAVEAAREAVAVVPAGHADRAGCLIVLAEALEKLSGRTGRGDLLEEAVEAAREAVAATPQDDPRRVVHINSLGTVLVKSFEHNRKSSRLEGAVAAMREAVAGTPPDHPDRFTYLGNLAAVLTLLAARPGALEESVRAGREAVAGTPPDHPMRATWLVQLGWALESLSETAGQPGLSDEARSCHREAMDCTAGETSVRVSACRSFALLTAESDAPAALEALECATDLLETLAPGSLSRSDRQYQLGRLVPGLAAEAAAAALAVGKPVRAVELLERCRGVLAAWVLGRRDQDLTSLRGQAPHLADQLDQLNARLDDLDRPQSAADREHREVHTAAAVAEGRQLASARRRTYEDRRSLLERIREIPGCERFLQAPDIADLTRAAQAGPVVFLTATRSRRDALILTGRPEDPVQTVPLAVSYEMALFAVMRLRGILRSVADRSLDPMERVLAQNELRPILAGLWDKVAEPVLTHLGHTAPPEPGQPWPEVWWCPVGELAELPVHAAGHHADPADRPGGPRTVLDRVVSSYATTVRALIQTGRRSSSPENSTLIVPVPRAPRAAALSGVNVETTAITGLVPDAHVLAAPTREAVLRALPDHRIAHFACHGVTDTADPSRSHLVLADHATGPLAVSDISALKLSAGLAYLSVCATSGTSSRLADESIHIASAFHLAGFRHVIGTLWSVDDRTSAQLAADFYASLTRNGTTEPRLELSARALHDAVRRLRTRYPLTPTLWAAYTHTGA
ncbi:CHAT domain-containing protein [Kitasatospora sp. NPDC056446]|uniref:CHAT domain-containing protein n=1 Tax=Kitasatospora sp. NPDC056446 TaxID=3345819 RepID=UPI0036A0CF3D